MEGHRRRATLALAVAMAAAGLLATASPAGAAKLPRIRHVFTIVLENKNYGTTFGTKAAPYLSKRLTRKGQLLTQYHGTGHFSLGNYITMVSGQAENPQTQADCQAFLDFLVPAPGPDGQALGPGCVYPRPIKTIADELSGKGLRWREYAQDMGSDPSREPSRCGHPALNSSDGTQSATATDQYATRHNPFVYFHSIIDRGEFCRRHVVPLGPLRFDLKHPRRMPNYAFITPDLCADGHDDDCVNPKQKGGYAGINRFLKRWVPRILRSRSYRRNGLLMVTFDESESGAEACCFVPPPLNTPSQGGIEGGPGGGRVGTVLISPWVKPGSVNATPYNHYSMLRTVEDLFGVGRLGYTARPAVKRFGKDVFLRHKRHRHHRRTHRRHRAARV